METKVFNLIILDESGSMHCIKSQALSGVNETLQTIRAAQEKYPDQEQYVTFVPFQSGNIRLVRDCENIRNIRDIHPSEYGPNGGTPLYDAIGTSVSQLRLKVSDVDSVLVTIITDGMENASRMYNARDIERLIGEMKECGWLFTYIGANQDAIEVARAINIHNAMNFAQDEAGTKAMFEAERCARTRFNEERHAQVLACACSVGEDKLEAEIRKAMRKQAKRTDYFRK